ncbi:hypothetical protein BgAZ_208780 [Babesia gibsoni]|uniref:Protein yippee-like n=1 Tax=Babesia gibsoni TaxID=33632 RepID=A0AAD8PES4_BABGI|nr:hypothetical protein BgAZ_208780 [Babesia gibsoni]
MGIPYEHVLDGYTVFTCAECGIDLTTDRELISTEFRGRTGAAWLFSKVHNVSECGFEERMMTTGIHAIVEIHCNRCGNNLGWKYIEASSPSQKYKQGKYILEKKLICGYHEEEFDSNSDE